MKKTKSGSTVNTAELPTDPTAFHPMKVTASRDIPIGFELEPITKKVTLDKSRIYSWWPKIKSRHSDYAAARATGLQKPNIAGNQTAEYLGELFIKFFGEGYIGGKLSIKFIGFVLPDDEVTAKGIVREKIIEGDAVRLVLDIWCENQYGEKVIVGTASGLVH